LSEAKRAFPAVDSAAMRSMSMTAIFVVPVDTPAA
jgi:hypothetical protein